VGIVDVGCEEWLENRKGLVCRMRQRRSKTASKTPPGLARIWAAPPTPVPD